MPVATSAAIKGLHNRDLVESSDPDILLANTYHLYLRPGDEIIKKSGGIHDFMSWDKNILTDSGGYQVYSLSANRKIEEEGVKFKSHIDGSYHFFSPEKAIQIQKNIGPLLSNYKSKQALKITKTTFQNPGSQLLRRHFSIA